MSEIFEQHRKEIIISILLIVAGGIIASSFIGLENLSDDPEENEQIQESYASPEEDSATVDSQVDEEALRVEIESSLSPSRPVVDIGDPVVFENQNDFPIRIEFDRTEEEPVIDSGEETQMRFNAVNYYDVYNHENDERITGGSISVDF